MYSQKQWIVLIPVVISSIKVSQFTLLNKKSKHYRKIACDLPFTRFKQINSKHLWKRQMTLTVERLYNLLLFFLRYIKYGIFMAHKQKNSSKVDLCEFFFVTFALSCIYSNFNLKYLLIHFLILSNSNTDRGKKLLTPNGTILSFVPTLNDSIVIFWKWYELHLLKTF